jgi:STE24 endopeptidase
MIKCIIILLYLSKEAFDAVIDFLDSQYLKKALPENVRDVYNEEEYQNWLSYEKECGRIDMISNLVDIILALTLLVSNAYAWIFNTLSGMSVYVQYLVLIFLLNVISSVIDLPFEYYETFVTEEKYGLNKSTRRTFWLDQIKSFFIGNAISYGFMMLVMLLFERFGNMAILWCSAAFLVIILTIMLIIVPLMRIYNKFDPLPDGELKDKLLSLCDKYGIRVRKIVVRDASRRTTTSNAFCTGIGNRKTISLDDNLVNEYSPEEITAVFAHEFAHARYHHAIKSLPFSMVNILVMFSSLAIVLNIPGLYTAFGFDGINFYFATMLTSVIIWPVSTIMGIIGGFLSRKHEYQADAFAAGEGYGEDLIAALKRLNRESLSDINPHPAVVILEYSHPTLSQRIDAIQKK